MSAIHKKCNWCTKTLDLDEFETRLVKGVQTVYSKCAKCRPMHAKSANTSANRAAVNKAAKQRFDNSDHGKASKRRYKVSEAGKARYQRYMRGESGKAARKRELAMRKKRRACDPAFALRECLTTAGREIVKGRIVDSPSFVERTSFDSVEHFREHMETAADHAGFSMAQYGTVWQNEHGIPQAAYDFSVPEDVRRCWSPANVRALSAGDNYAKGVTILDELCMQVGSEHFPLSWKEKLLTHDEKEAFYAICKQPWVPPDDMPEAAEEDGSESESDDDESDSDSSE